VALAIDRQSADLRAAGKTKGKKAIGSDGLSPAEDRHPPCVAAIRSGGGSVSRQRGSKVVGRENSWNRLRSGFLRSPDWVSFLLVLIRHKHSSCESFSDSNRQV
jgi:hypothetical protein